MILSPETVLSKEYLSSKEVPINKETQLQPNGIDVRVKNIELIGNTSFKLFISDTTHSTRTQVKRSVVDGKETFRVFPGRAFSVECYEWVTIPVGVAARVHTRSRLNRNGIFVGSGLYDSGFSGPVGFTFYPFSNGIIQVGVRVAQIVFYRSEEGSLYNGSYGEKT